jgi:hypothetical protein
MLLIVFLCVGIASYHANLNLRMHIPENMLPPSLLIAATLSLSGGLLLISNCVVTLSALFFAKDLDRILSAPIERRSIFIARYVEIFVTASWMPFFLTIFALAGLGGAYGFPFLYYLKLPFITLLYFSIPTSLAIFLITFIFTVVPPKRTRDIFLGAAFATLVILLLILRSLFSTSVNINTFEEVIFTLRFLSLDGRWWSLPSHTASALADGVSLTAVFQAPLFKVILAALSVFSGSLLFLTTFFDRALECAMSSQYNAVSEHDKNYSKKALLAKVLPGDAWAIAFKERLLIMREPAHLFQLLLILGLWGLYIYNLQFLKPIPGMPISDASWWLVAFLTLHFVLSHFMCIATINRFAFASISFEGECFWIISSAPISMARYLWAKFIFWLVVLMPINGVALGFGVSIITQSVPIIIFATFIGAVMAMSLIGLAVGLGAKFANFSWEHFAELAASLGSVLFMLCALLILFLNAIPTVIIFDLLANHRPFYMELTAVGILLIVLLNTFIALYVMRIGVRALTALTI